MLRPVVQSIRRFTRSQEENRNVEGDSAMTDTLLSDDSGEENVSVGDVEVCFGAEEYPPSPSPSISTATPPPNLWEMLGISFESNASSSNSEDVLLFEQTRSIMWHHMRNARLAIPLARRLALLQSIRGATDFEGLHNLFVDNITTSNYTSNKYKCELAEAVLSEDWVSVKRIAATRHKNVATKELSSPNPLQSGVWRLTALARALTTRRRCSQDLLEFKLMAIAIFSSSKKLRNLTIRKRRRLGHLILSIQSKEEALERLICEVLPNAETLDNEACELIADDALQCRFDRLLLPTRLDCERCARLNPSVLFPIDHEEEASIAPEMPEPSDDDDDDDDISYEA